MFAKTVNDLFSAIPAAISLIRHNIESFVLVAGLYLLTIFIPVFLGDSITAAILNFAVTVIAYFALLLASYSAHTGKSVDFTGELGRLGTLVAASLLFGLMFLPIMFISAIPFLLSNSMGLNSGGSIFITGIVAGIILVYFILRFLFMPIIATLERNQRGIWASFSKSAEIMEGKKLAIIVFFILFALLFAVTVGVFGAIFSVVGLVDFSTLGEVNSEADLPKPLFLLVALLQAIYGFVAGVWNYLIYVKFGGTPDEIGENE